MVGLLYVPDFLLLGSLPRCYFIEQDAIPFGILSAVLLCLTFCYLARRRFLINKILHFLE
ncbi:hypothetical protein BCR42DRAFT_202347 [Absidia repens]|uniref:Uncharacterized protein n=1 Tax=Absidia repens TaxID=90262 RepID=A0A1X2HKJ8_9FUNG|nr:hypothetical protein BCR42DRAFT_202347 [Absidia repens]